jgi:hypothetical protein
MTSIIPFLRPHDGEFDVETTRLMGEAFDMAVSALSPRPPIVYGAIASGIIAAARCGERDPERLCRAGSAGIGTCC